MPLMALSQEAEGGMTFQELQAKYDEALSQIKELERENASDFLTNLFTLSSTIRRYFRFILSFR